MSEPLQLFRVEDGHRGAEFSRCGWYRYSPWRGWDDSLPRVLFVGLNPSTADAEQDDPTIRRCIRFARDWGYGGLWMANLFAYRSTDPDVVPAGPVSVGPENDEWIARLRDRAGLVVAAWGVHKAQHYGNRAGYVLDLLGDEVHIFGLTAKGYPMHPVRLRASLTPTRWTRA